VGRRLVACQRRNITSQCLDSYRSTHLHKHMAAPSPVNYTHLLPHRSSLASTIFSARQFITTHPNPHLISSSNTLDPPLPFPDRWYKYTEFVVTMKRCKLLSLASALVGLGCFRKPRPIIISSGMIHEWCVS